MQELMSYKAKQIFGQGYDVISLERLFGGAQKHTYLAKCANDFRFVIYQWDKSTTYFESNQEGAMFCSSSALLFEKNNELMREHGVLTPKLYYMDRSRDEVDYEYAFVEFIDGVDLDYLLAKEENRVHSALESLKQSICRLHSIKSEAVGQADRMQDADFDLIAYELEGIHENALFLQENDSEYASSYIEAEKKAASLAESLEKRNTYTLIHGELGPNHVMVDKNNQAYLIDIEGAKFYDVEEENSFMKMRFGNRITGLADVVDEKRMEFYHIGHCFGNLRGAIELKQKNYYDMEDVDGMIRVFHRKFEELCSR